MKTTFFVLFCVTAFASPAFSAEPVEVNSAITGVTVFLRGAQVTRDARVSLQKGTTTLTFRDLPVNLDPQSIQAKGEGNFIILSLLHQVNYLAGQRRTAQVAMLQDSLKWYDNKLAWVKSQQLVLQREEEMLNANRAIGSAEKGVVLSELKLAVDYYRARLTDIKREELKLAHETSMLSERAEKIRKQLQSLTSDLKKPTSEVLVNVSCNQAVTGNLVLTYTVYEAGWTPAYDIRAINVQSPVELFYNARVYQGTGEDWEKVSVKLSTANPQQQGVKPDLQPWFIDFEQPVGITRAYNMARPNVLKKAEMSIADDVAEEAEAVAPMAASTAASYTEVNETQTNLEFSIKLPYDIPSDNKQYTINIQDYNLPAEYEYYCAPKLDRESFLVARITGWENYNLISGEMNLFFEGTYVGKSYLNVRNTNDTLELSLGRDKSIVVTRVKLKDFTEERTIGSNKRETRAWEITVRNTKKLAVNLRLEDQLPVSMNKDIEVEPLEYSGGSLNKATGIITWRLKAEPAVDKKLRVSYAIRYPKDQRVYID